MTTQRGIARITTPTTLHHDAIRVGRAAIMPGDWQQHDPFLSMMDDNFGKGAFGPHPHRGFETLTYVLDGELRHEDNKGGAGTLGVGDAQWMTAGRGVIHNESPAADGPVHVLQLWINLPAKDKLVESRYQDLRGALMPVHREPGVEVRVFSGRSGDAVGPALNYTPVTMLDIRMQPGSRFQQTLDGGDNSFIHVISGSGRFSADEVRVDADHTIWLTQSDAGSDSAITIEADSELHLLLMSGPPLNEPVVAHGPFVMNSREQIVQAFADYQNGAFGPAF